MKHLGQHFWSMTSCLVAVALLATFLPHPALAGETPAANDQAPFYYPLRAGALDHPTGEITARIEYRSGHRILDTQELILDFRGRDGALLPVQPFPGVSPLAIEVPKLEIYVFADGLLVDVLDREALRAFDRDLAAVRRLEPRESTGFDGPGTLEPVEPDAVICGSPCGGGCGPSEDYDCDGVANSVDNCTDNYNPGQQDCDGDGIGDACDSLNGVFQAASSVQTCMTDKDVHLDEDDWEHHVEQEMTDVSACNAPNFWNRWIRWRDTCPTYFDEFKCCIKTIGNSITEVGDSNSLWCGSKRNQDFCH